MIYRDSYSMNETGKILRTFCEDNYVPCEDNLTLSRSNYVSNEGNYTLSRNNYVPSEDNPTLSENNYVSNEGNYTFCKNNLTFCEDNRQLKYSLTKTFSKFSSSCLEALSSNNYLKK